MKKIALSFAAVAMMACTKTVDAPQQGVFIALKGGKTFSWNKASVSYVPFCGQRLYTIEAKADQGIFMINVVCDSLVKGSYDAGTNIYTSTWQWGEHIRLDMETETSGRFAGETSSGNLNISK